MLSIRKATASDAEQIMDIYRTAQDFMIQSGNPGQWGHTYPPIAQVCQDIEEEICHVLYDDEGIHGVFALLEEPDPYYQRIDDGEWINDDPYVAIHRIAGDGTVHGIFDCAAHYCKERFPNIRIDTHEKNLVMQHLIEKNGFRKCGIIYVRDHTPRIAYQWIRI